VITVVQLAGTNFAAVQLLFKSQVIICRERGPEFYRHLTMPVKIFHLSSWKTWPTLFIIFFCRLEDVGPAQPKCGLLWHVPSKRVCFTYDIIKKASIVHPLMRRSCFMQLKRKRGMRVFLRTVNCTRAQLHVKRPLSHYSKFTLEQAMKAQRSTGIAILFL